jgi:ABC-type antimicrobial peptide transport system permease subunit
LDAALPVYEIATGEQVVADATSRMRFSSALLGIFAALALLLAAAGVYAVVSYSAAARTPEIGVRLALGAEPGKVVRLMMRDAALLCLGGLALGALAALAATRLLVGSLYAVEPNDLTTFLLLAGASRVAHRSAGGVALRVRCGPGNPAWACFLYALVSSSSTVLALSIPQTKRRARAGRRAALSPRAADQPVHRTRNDARGGP